MVTKSPKKQVLGKRHPKKRNSTLRVLVSKLDDHVYETYRNRLIGTYGNPIPVKEERSCIFASEIDLDANEHGPSNESSGPCQCSYCLRYQEMKSQGYEQYLDPAQDQENVCNGYSYLRDLVQENAELYPYCHENVPAPPAVEMRDAETQTDPRPSKYICKDCGSGFNDQRYYNLHVLVHVARLYECAFCNASYPSLKELGTHVLMHNNIYFQCIECPCAFRNKKHLIQHMRTHRKNFECGDCKAQFGTEHDLQNHKKTHASSGKMIHVFRKLKGQSKPATEVAVVETESATVHEEPRVQAPRFFQCDLCNLQFTNAGQLARHNSIHNRSAANFSHSCSVCQARFRTRSYLALHKRHAHKV